MVGLVLQKPANNFSTPAKEIPATFSDKIMGMDILRYSHEAVLSPVHTAP